MYQKDFIPVALIVKMKSGKSLPVEKWQQLIEDLFLVYAESVTKKDGCIIGHIKALAEVSEVSYIKFSCVNALIGVNSEFHGKPQNINEINMVINSLVTNMDILESRELLSQSWLVTINPEENIIMQVEDETSNSRGEHHHHKKNEPYPIGETHHQDEQNIH